MNSPATVADGFNTPNGALVFSQAGTAISKRYKGERNSFNVIEVDRPHLRVQKYTWDADQSAYEARAGEVLDFVMSKERSGVMATGSPGHPA